MYLDLIIQVECNSNLFFSGDISKKRKRIRTSESCVVATPPDAEHLSKYAGISPISISKFLLNKYLLKTSKL